MIALAIWIGVILLCSSSKEKKSEKKTPSKTLLGTTSGYDPQRQKHWTREDTVEFTEL